MFSFDFANKLYLIGLVAAAIPLIIHLSRSRRTKKIVFSTTRFFTDQFLRSYRMSRLQEILLLALRMALFAFLAMALAQPFIKPQGAGALAGTGPRNVVIVLDDSASMAYQEEGTPLFKRAQEAASAILKTLGPDDRVSLVLAGDQAGGPEVLAEPTAQFEEVQRLIDRTQPGYLATDLSGAIARAEELASAHKVEGGTSIYVISDLQDSGWTAASPGARAGNFDTAYFFVSVRPKTEPMNRAITALKYPATRPRVGVPFSVQALISVNGDDRKDITVQFHVDNEKVGEHKADCPATARTFAGPTLVSITPSRRRVGTPASCNSKPTTCPTITNVTSRWKCPKQTRRCPCWPSTAPLRESPVRTNCSSCAWRWRLPPRANGAPLNSRPSPPTMSPPPWVAFV
jgi:hypothetical protein